MADRKIAAMHKVYGKAHGYKCGGCPNLCGYTASRTWYKCLAYGNSASEATDWARSWPACGLYGQPVDKGHVPLLERLKRAKRPDNKPIEGQISMFGGNENDHQ